MFLPYYTCHIFFRHEFIYHFCIFWLSIIQFQPLKFFIKRHRIIEVKLFTKFSFIGHFQERLIIHSIIKSRRYFKPINVVFQFIYKQFHFAPPD